MPGSSQAAGVGAAAVLSQSSSLPELSASEAQSLAATLRLPPGVQPSARAIQAARFRLRRRMMAAKQEGERKNAGNSGGQSCAQSMVDGSASRSSEDSGEKSERAVAPRRTISARGYSLVLSLVGTKVRDLYSEHEDIYC